ncbi:MAG: hypothetical protein BWY85_00733 [Firmicutes bacterium ADurb.Bin506]|nr:MAG: hypothetical protein BWY85_00733 [Firmicutes bacterium ADurb.Bin506]
MAERPTRAQRGIPRAGNGRAEAMAARAEGLHGYRPDVVLKRDAKAERTGKRARYGDGMTDADAAQLDAMRAARADGYLVPRTTRDERAAWHALATEGWASTDADDTTNHETNGEH